MSRLVIVSNRTPTAGPAAGGLAVALKKPLSERSGFWFGWSGKLVDQPSAEPRFSDVNGVDVGVIDLTKDDYDSYYAGYANSILWPAFHQRLDLANIDSRWYEGYRRVNTQFARALKPLLRPDDLIWVHDYHLIPFGSELRALGVKNRIGFYLHIPFPTADGLQAIPHQAELMRDLARYDLIGLQAERDLAEFRTGMGRDLAPALEGVDRPAAEFSNSQVAVFPIGSDPASFARLARGAAARKMIKRMQSSLNGQALILGVDRLDYSKGLPQRVEAYENLLANNPQFHRGVHFLQVAPPSRDSIKEYRDISETLDAVVGRVMGRFSEPDWQPLTYVKRAYSQASLAGLYRLARVGLVTPLRDGMNLVAHEYVASQDPHDPGVLVLSHFAGAAEIFQDALRVNPFDAEETAQAMRLALTMPLDERLARWKSLLAVAENYSVDKWADRFIAALSAGSGGGGDELAGAVRAESATGPSPDALT
ncbi:MAG TPA: trehalose-6-phosphate synthase [Devosiaceae bacterium]|nr:trehalose-6-phosphate synthase [Devosiaceae bacterium]